MSSAVSEDEHIKHARYVGTGTNFLMNFSTGAVFRSSSSRSGARICDKESSPVRAPAVMWGDMDLLLHVETQEVCKTKTSLYANVDCSRKPLVPYSRFKAVAMEVWSVAPQAETSASRGGSCGSNASATITTHQPQPKPQHRLQHQLQQRLQHRLQHRFPRRGSSATSFGREVW